MASSRSGGDGWADVAAVLQGSTSRPGPVEPPPAPSPPEEDLPERAKINEVQILSEYTQVRNAELATDCTGVDAPRVGLIAAKVNVEYNSSSEPLEEARAFCKAAELEAKCVFRTMKENLSGKGFCAPWRRTAKTST